MTAIDIAPAPGTYADLLAATRLALTKPACLPRFAEWYEMSRYQFRITPELDGLDRALLALAEGRASLSTTERRLRRWAWDEPTALTLVGKEDTDAATDATADG